MPNVSQPNPAMVSSHRPLPQPKSSTWPPPGGGVRMPATASTAATRLLLTGRPGPASVDPAWVDAHSPVSEYQERIWLPVGRGVANSRPQRGHPVAKTRRRWSGCAITPSHSASRRRVRQPAQPGQR